MKELKNLLNESICEWSKANLALGTNAKKVIKTILSKVPNKRIYINDEFPCCVTYDGGNHPEHDANPFSSVESVSLFNDKIRIDTEDVNDYDAEDLASIELYYVACSVIQSFEKDYEDEV